jgi:hypothetical protein
MLKMINRDLNFKRKFSYNEFTSGVTGALPKIMIEKRKAEVNVYDRVRMDEKLYSPGYSAGQLLFENGVSGFPVYSGNAGNALFPPAGQSPVGLGIPGSLQ